MNFLSHAMNHLDRPYVVAGTAVPDWLTVVDRRIRVRSKHAEPLLSGHDEVAREIAEGILQHHRDDLWFHNSRVFNETMLQFAVELRDRLPGDEGFRPSFVGHILVEMLLDATLLARDPSLGQRYYEAIEAISTVKVQTVVNQIARSQTIMLAPLISRFANARFLYDYLEDDKLLMRLNQVMLRVGLPQLPDGLVSWLAEARCVIDSRSASLMTPG